MVSITLCNKVKVKLLDGGEADIGCHFVNSFSFTPINVTLNGCSDNPNAFLATFPIGEYLAMVFFP